MPNTILSDLQKLTYMIFTTTLLMICVCVHIYIYNIYILYHPHFTIEKVTGREKKPQSEQFGSKILAHHFAKLPLTMKK